MSSPLPQAQVDSLIASRRDGWNVSTKEEWQDWVQSQNMELTMKCRHYIQDRSYTFRSLGEWLDIPEWLVMCLVGMPTNRWWMMKGEWEITGGVRLP